jgi:thymidylate synthase (FAD)
VTEFNTDDEMHVEVVKHNLSDADVIWAARVSTAGEASLESLDEDPAKSRGLIRFLLRERHGSPFEHGSITFRVTMPRFVGREQLRHRAGFSYNEESGRYRKYEPNFYVPGPERPLVQVGKAGAYTFELGTEEQYNLMLDAYFISIGVAWEQYNRMLDGGIAREVARGVLPEAIFSTMYITCNARSLMHYLSLRTKDDRAEKKSYPQWEIEQVARQMEASLAELMPITYEAFNDYGRVAP